MTGLLQGANELVSEEAPSNWPDSTNLIAFIHTFIQYIDTEHILCAKHSFDPVDASVSKIVKDHLLSSC